MPTVRDCQGIIPAYAGSTSLWSGAAGSGGDHPRIRGEHQPRQAHRTPEPGSSPHTRGAQTGCASYILYYRDHPRIRGEHVWELRASVLILGSSPHTRGARDNIVIRLVHVGIIPAYAGSTCGFLPRSAFPEDHPRIRGEHRLDIPWPQAMQGSSPHTRGARRLRHGDRARARIIPAYAGSTPLGDHAEVGARDHPRIRGEHRRPGFGSFWRRGIIPAYAGSTPTRQRPSGCRRDHPRIRGEHVGHDEAQFRGDGSSPHTRGARRRDIRSRNRVRIIPAYAGST